MIRTDKRSCVVIGSMSLEHAVPQHTMNSCVVCVLCVTSDAVIGDDSVTSLSDRHVIKPSRSVQLGGCGRWQLMIGRRRSLDTDTPLDHLLCTVKLIARRRHTDTPAAASCYSVLPPRLVRISQDERLYGLLYSYVGLSINCTGDY